MKKILILIEKCKTLCYNLISFYYCIDKNSIELDLSDNEIGNTEIKALSCVFKRTKTLERINLSMNIIGDRELKLISRAIKDNKSITELNLSINHIGNRGIIYLYKSLKLNYYIKNLDLGYNYIGDEGATTLAYALLFNNTLEHINLEFNFIGAYGAFYLSKAIEVNDALKSLNLRANIIKIDGLKYIMEVLQKKDKPYLSLDISNNYFSKIEEIKCVSDYLTKNKSIESFRLSDNINNDDLKLILKALKYNYSITNMAIRGISKKNNEFLHGLLHRNKTVKDICSAQSSKNFMKHGYTDLKLKIGS